MPDGGTQADIAAIDRRLTRQVHSWLTEMIQITPIAQWDAELTRLLDDWACDYGVTFTSESVDAVMRWMAHEQQLALAEEGAGTGLQDNRDRRYDAGTGHSPSENPIGREAGDANPYVGNGPTNPRSLRRYWLPGPWTSWSRAGNISAKKAMFTWSAYRPGVKNPKWYPFSGVSRWKAKGRWVRVTADFEILVDTRVDLKIILVGPSDDSTIDLPGIATVTGFDFPRADLIRKNRKPAGHGIAGIRCRKTIYLVQDAKRYRCIGETRNATGGLDYKFKEDVKTFYKRRYILGKLEVDELGGLRCNTDKKEQNTLDWVREKNAAKSDVVWKTGTPTAPTNTLRPLVVGESGLEGDGGWPNLGVGTFDDEE